MVGNGSAILNNDELMGAADLMTQVDLFKGVQPDDLLTLCRGARMHAYQDGEMLFEEGDEGGAVYIVQAGVVKIMLHSGVDVKQISTCFEGDVVGELALLDERPRSARAVASGKVQTVEIQRDDFLDFMLARPPVMLALLETLTHRARRLSDRVEGNIEWLGKLARGDFEHATGFALRLAPAMFNVAPSRPLVRQSTLDKAVQGATLKKGGLFAALDERTKTDDPQANTTTA